MINLRMHPNKIYDTLRSSIGAEQRRNELMKSMKSTEAFNPTDYPNAIGSFDATSCLGCIFTAQDKKHILSTHFDGRNLENLVPIFNSYKGDKVTLEICGGVQKRDAKGELGNDYKLLEKHTQDNFHELIDFTKQLDCTIDFKSWTIGDETNREGLICEYLASPKEVILLQTGTIHQKCLPPELVGRYTSHSLIKSRGTPIVFDATQSDKFTFSPVDQSTLPGFRKYANRIKSCQDDATLLHTFSTTPDLEPSYFCETYRKVADFVLSAEPQYDVNPILPQNTPCILLQGEAGRIKY